VRERERSQRKCSQSIDSDIKKKKWPEKQQKRQENLRMANRRTHKKEKHQRQTETTKKIRERKQGRSGVG